MMDYNSSWTSEVTILSHPQYTNTPMNFLLKTWVFTTLFLCVVHTYQMIWALTSTRRMPPPFHQQKETPSMGFRNRGQIIRIWATLLHPTEGIHFLWQAALSATSQMGEAILLAGSNSLQVSLPASPMTFCGNPHRKLQMVIMWSQDIWQPVISGIRWPSTQTAIGAWWVTWL